MNAMVQATVVPALAKNARTGHPCFRMGKREMSESLGHPPNGPNTVVLGKPQNPYPMGVAVPYNRATRWAFAFNANRPGSLNWTVNYQLNGSQQPKLTGKQTVCQ